MHFLGWTLLSIPFTIMVAGEIGTKSNINPESSEAILIVLMVVAFWYGIYFLLF